MVKRLLQQHAKTMETPNDWVYVNNFQNQRQPIALELPSGQGPKFQATVDLDGVSLSTSQDVLFAIADGVGPEHSVITLGYAGWEAGQLEAELANNAWLTCPYDADILFNTASELRLEAAAAKLRVNLSLLTSQAGHA